MIDSGKEMMSHELLDVVPKNYVSKELGKPIAIFVKISGENQYSINCSLYSIEKNRIELGDVPAASAVKLYKELSSNSNVMCFLQAYDETFDLGKNVSLLGFSNDFCSVLFNEDET